MTSNCKHPTCNGDTCRREPTAKRTRKHIKRSKPISRYNAKPKEKNDKLEQFFQDSMDIIARHPYCSNCGAWISPKFYRHAVAHLLPKSIFISVAAHPLNWLSLGATCSCHEQSHRLDKFSQMPVFRMAVDRFRQFEHLITEKHKLLDLFKEYAEKVCPTKN